jgi:lysozyme family protein
MTIKRRDLLVGGLAAGAFATSGDMAVAQSAKAAGGRDGSRLDRELRGVFAQANQLHLGVPLAAGPTSPLDLANLVERLISKGASNDDEENLALRAGLLLSELTRDQRDGHEILPSDPVAAAVKYPYTDDLKREYERMFKTAKIAPANASELKRVADFITSSGPKARYKKVESDTGVPWYVVGALHYREANLNFMGHLHNGDPLLLRTVHVPANRPPKPWTPPGVTDPEQLWRVSSKDALHQLTVLVSSWSVQRMCYAFESYNGFGCRSNGVRSPYLWNYTNFYSGGGFPRDHVFDPNYRSKQAGVAAIIVKLHEVDPDGVQLKFDS